MLRILSGLQKKQWTHNGNHKFIFSGMGCQLWETKDDIPIIIPKSNNSKSIPSIWLSITKVILLETQWTL